MSDLAACDACGVVVTRQHTRRSGADSCPVCDHQGRKVKYANGETARQDWFSTVRLEGDE